MTTSKQGFMKGPWNVVEHSWSDTSVVGPDGTICTISIYDEATEENQEELEQRTAERARLISSAPELYEALNNALGWIQGGEKGAKAARDKARAALARAAGGLADSLASSRSG